MVPSPILVPRPDPPPALISPAISAFGVRGSRRLGAYGPAPPSYHCRGSSELLLFFFFFPLALPSELPRRHSSSAGSSFPGRGRQLGNSNGSSSFQNGSNSPPWSASRSSSPPGWEIGCRKQSAGLGNLGNTCFMNSSLQCLANIKEFKDFFLTGRHVPEINRWNPIGHRGELAQAYADTVKAMWSTGSTSHAPRKLKETVGRCESRFQGYEQHDSQEFISFLLDGLHEDLNRVQDKPVVRRYAAPRARSPRPTQQRGDTRQRPGRAEPGWLILILVSVSILG